MRSETPLEGELILYQTQDGRTRVECRFHDETLWLSQALMAELFQTTPQNITQHLKSLYEEGEISEAGTCKDYLQVRQEGTRQVRRSVRYYNLDAILAVGYRVRSLRGMQFRQWATERLREYLVKGFTMDDERLRNPPVEGSGIPDYFDELLERIRDIRASERRMYLRVRDIFALAADYQPARLDDFLRFNEREVLVGSGSVSSEAALAHAEAEYDRFAAHRRELAEAEGERANFAALESAARRLPRHQGNSEP